MSEIWLSLSHQLLCKLTLCFLPNRRSENIAFQSEDVTLWLFFHESTSSHWCVAGRHQSKDET